MTRVLTIGYARQVFDAQSAERARLAACARTVDALHVVVFSRRTDGYTPVHDGTLHAYPTRSRARPLMLFDAYRLGSVVLEESRQSRETWLISAQDPFEAGLVGYLLHLRYGVPLQVQEHGDFFGSRWWRTESILNRIRYPFGKWLIRRADCVRAVSARVVRHLVAIGVDKRCITSQPVASDLTAFMETGHVDAAHDLHATYPDAEVVVLAVGRLVKEKNFSSLIRAFGRVSETHPMAQLVLIGSGPEESHLRQMAVECGVSPRVAFIPWTDATADYMHSSDLFVLCSYREGWGRVIVEAMCAGLPGVVTDVGCAGEVFKDGQHGRVVPVADDEALRVAMEEMIADPKRLRRFGSDAAKDGAGFFSQQAPYPDAWYTTITACVAEEKHV